LMISMIIQTIPVLPSRSVWTDGPSNVRSLDPSGAVKSDASIRRVTGARWGGLA
jgi:hypothetical protein